MTPERQDTAEAGDIDAFPRVFPLVASFGALQRSSFCRLAERKAGTRTRLARIGLSLIITYVALHAAETLLIWPDWSGCRRTHIRRSTGHDGQFTLNGRGGFHTHLASSRCCFVNDRRESLSDCLDIFPPAPYCSNHRCAEGGLAAAQKEFGRASCLQHRKAPTRMRSGVHEGHRRVSSSLKISELT